MCMQLTWDNRDIKQMNLSLSEERPVEGHCTEHETCTDVSFDFHYPLELGVVISGEMQRLYRDHEDTLSTGGIWFCGVCEPHGYRVTKPGTEDLVLTIWPPLLASLRLPEDPHFPWLAPFRCAPAQRPQVARERIPDLIALAQRCKDILAEADESAPGKMRLRFVLLELLLCMCEDWQPSEAKQKDSSDYFSRISQAIELVFSTRYAVSVEKAAESCAMSRNIFSKHFQRVMGISFAQFSLRFRLNGVAQELLKSEKPIKAIAHNWGFTDDAHLQRRFQEAYDCSPHQFRMRDQ